MQRSKKKRYSITRRRRRAVGGGTVRPSGNATTISIKLAATIAAQLSKTAPAAA
jgi:hypothetical protein